VSKFNIPRIARPVDLAKYAPELAEEIAAAAPPIYMWVNLTRGFRSQYAEIRQESQKILEVLIAAGKPDKDKKAGEAQVKVKVEELSHRGEALNDHMAAWWAEAWSQGPESARWTVEQVQAFLSECSEQDPALWDFIVAECWRMVNDHRESARKN
jgi:hypothetical protein